MKFLTLLTLCLFYAMPALAAKEDETSPEVENRTRYAVELLRKTCLMYFTDRSGLTAVLDEKYKRAPVERAEKELAFVRAAKGGEVWLAVMSPKTSYTIISETEGNCHVMAQQTNSTLLHKHVKNLALDIRDSGSFNVVDYKGVPEDAKLVKISEFVVKAPDGDVILTARAATKENSKTELAESVLSVFRPPAR
ncbi:MAG: hypothetical protein DYH13_02955 [Alphaproteobacteria bacterium PRO2]|nr:hypothetical protein [Alphaproteobacteria bacterium PRO2]